MNDFEDQLRRLLHQATGEPPRTLDPSAVRARARHQTQRRRRVAASVFSAAVLIVAISVPLAVLGGHHRAPTVVSGGARAPAQTPSLIVSPSHDLTSGQTVRVMLRGFPADQKVLVFECPTPLEQGSSCAPSSRPPTPGAMRTLTTNRAGTSSGSFVVEQAPAGFARAYGRPACAPGCLLAAHAAAPAGAPPVSATAPLSFASRSTTSTTG